jgi:PAS domain S-box-containing protein
MGTVSGEQLQDSGGFVTAFGGISRSTDAQPPLPFFDFLEGVPLGVFIVDGNGCVIECNALFLVMAGAPRDRVIGFNLLRFSRDPALVPYLRRALAGESVDFESPYTSTTGDKSSHYHYVFRPLPSDVAGEARLLCFAQDISKIKSVERTNSALRLSEEKFSKAFLNSPDPMIISEIATGRTHEINEAFTQAFGYSREEVIGLSAVEIGLWADPVQRDRTVMLIREQGSLSNHEIEQRTRDGRILTMLGSATQLSIDGDMYWLAQFRDITERKKIEAELIAAKQGAENASLAKSRFLAAASHDLRQPMQAIGLFRDALARTDLNLEQKRILDYLGQSTRSTGEMLDALLDISKLDAGAVQVTHELIQAQSLARQIDAEFAPAAAEKSLRFKLSFPFRDMAMLTDGKLLMGLLRNLIGNAIKYTGKGGVLVAIRRSGNQALIQVWDTGIGIAGEHLDTIYDEYFQIGNDERDRSKGLGLGLAIARRIAKLLETEIRCHSRPGKGSVFEFRLPLATGGESAPSSQSDPPKVTASAKPAGRHIVLVEDDLMVGTSTKLALESCGMTVACYKTAEEALADPDIAEADFYISDLRLPGKDGIEFLDAVQQWATKPVKAVVLTGDTAVNRIEMMRSTSWPVLFKPVDLASLLAAIEARGSRP